MPATSKAPARRGGPRSRSLACLVALLLVAAGAAAQDWPQWRGQKRDVSIPGFTAPAAWPDKLATRWRVTVGVGYSSPVVAGGRVFVFARDGEREVVSSRDLASGAVVWQDGYAAPYQMNPAATAHGKGPKSTPVLHAGRLFTLGISGILSSYDQQTGRLVWRKDFKDEFPQATPLYGVAMSPVVESGQLIAHVGQHDRGALTAFDAATGAVKWRWTGDGPAYSSPVVAAFGGVRQVVTQSQKQIVGVAADSGTLLWSLPFSTPYDQNSVTPLVYQGLVIYSGLSQPTTAVRIVRKGTGWGAERVWENADVSMYMSSPVPSGDLLFGLSHKRKGQFFCLDARTGKTLWITEGREAENVALLTAAGTLFLLTNEAELLVARASGERFDLIKRYAVADSPTWAHSALVDRGVLIKDERTLALLTIG